MSRGKKFALILGDVCVLYISLGLTLLLRYGPARLDAKFQDHLLPFSLLFIAWLIIFLLFDLYHQKSFVNLNAVANRLLTAVCIAVVTSIALFYLFGFLFTLTPKTNLLIFAVVFTFLDYLARVLFRRAASFRPSAAIIIGTSPQVKEIVAFLEHNPHAGYRTAEWIRALSPENLATLPALIKSTGAHTLIVEPRLTKDAGVVRSLYGLLPLGVTIFNFSDFYELMFERVPLEELEEGWFIEHVVTRRPAYDAVKRLLDFILSLLLFFGLLPLTILIAIAVRLTSPGPAIFAQKRVGKNNREFRLFKFRTMNTWSGGNDGTPAWTLKNDARITGFGKFLRATHLDELPQLWNILRGDISFTGPRPERVELAVQYGAFPYYEVRHVVQPGLTGWAQINYRPSASLDEAKEKLRYDIYYVKNRSFLLDLAITLKTIKYIFTSHE